MEKTASSSLSGCPWASSRVQRLTGRRPPTFAIHCSAYGPSRAARATSPSSSNKPGKFMNRTASTAALLCALFAMPARAQDFLAGVVSIDVTMTKDRGETCIASQYGVGTATTAAGRHLANGSTPMPSRLRIVPGASAATSLSRIWRTAGRSRCALMTAGPSCGAGASTLATPQHERSAWAGWLG